VRPLFALPWLLAAMGVSCSGPEQQVPRSVRVIERPSVARVAVAPVAVAPRPSPVDEAPASPPPAPPLPPPELVALAREVVVYQEPNRRSEKLGYLRLGARVARSREPSGRDGCSGGWYRIMPYGFACSGPAASIDPNEPVAVLARTRPDRNAALPYAYGRSKPVPPPLYATLPSAAEAKVIEGRAPGAATEWLDLESAPPHELVAPGRPLPAPLGYARTAAVTPPRALPDAGFALLDVFDHDGRRFGLTTDLDLVPLDRLTRVTASAFHGLPLGGEVTLPVAFTRTRHAWLYEGSPARGLRPLRSLGLREALPLSGERKVFDRIVYLRAGGDTWIRAEQVQVIERPAGLPPWASGTKSWIHVSIRDQTLVAYVGALPVYATLVSTGSGGLGDPKETHATPRGEFVIHTKHVAVTMSGDELGDEYDLRDVPYVQYFTEGYALHAAYWHDSFGQPKSHGCVNLSPLDARALFHLTEPGVPQAWHGAVAASGTLVSITP